MLAVFFGVLMLLALVGLAVVAPRDIPRISGTVALVLTLAALGVAILH